MKDIIYERVDGDYGDDDDDANIRDEDEGDDSNEGDDYNVRGVEDQDGPIKPQFDLFSVQL